MVETVSKKVTPHDILRKKGSEKIVMVTAYDYPSAELAEKAGVDIVLVGDSGGMVMLGYESTTHVSLDEIMMLCKAVSRGAKKPLLVGDMPFLSYQVSIEEAVRNAGRFVKEGGVDAIKLEGGEEYESTIRAICRAGIPVMGHIGLMPQTAALWSSYKVRGRTADEASKILDDAKAVERAGAFSMVLESMTSEAAQLVTENVRIPTIGIGAGLACDGQVLVYHDLLGLQSKIMPRFVKRYADLSKIVIDAISSYRNDVLTGSFPAEEYSYHMEKEEAARLQALKKKMR
ncbi:MAG: 3-methyl-2-oxobutanoate hydroxymethyltransferase [Thaumarchaeota archaeon]|nr:3-methyl-2-oxobutanoate hydroxymethyltransferase [Nitrososphaerota archaeon]